MGINNKSERFEIGLGNLWLGFLIVYFETVLTSLGSWLSWLNSFLTSQNLPDSKSKSKSYTQYSKQRISKPPQIASLEKLRSEGVNAPGVPDNFSPGEFPPWFNPELAAKGQEFARQNSAGIYYGAFLQFIFFLTDTDTRRILLDTRKSNSPEKSFRRYISNFLHVELWFLSEIEAEKTFFKSLNSVLQRHKNALHRATTRNDVLQNPLIPEPKDGENPHKVDLKLWEAFDKDLKDSGLTKSPIMDKKGNDLKFNQYSMSIALFLHFASAIICPDKIFIHGATEQELLGFLHFWAFIGHAIGVQDEFNICLQPDLQTAKVYLRNFLNEYLVPTLFDLDYETKVLFEALFKGINNGFSTVENPGHDNPNGSEFFLLRLLEDVLEIPCPNMRAILTTRQKVRAFLIQIINQPYIFKWIRTFLNQYATNFINAIGRTKFGMDNTNPDLVAEKGFV